MPTLANMVFFYYLKTGKDLTMDKDRKEIRAADNLVDILRVEGVNAKGFGTIPKAVMKDRRLSIQAKAIYAYFCSYAGAGNRPFPSRRTITEDLQISINTYHKHLNKLKSLDYIRVKQRKKSGVFTSCIYTIVEKPVIEPISPCTKICDTAGPHTKKPYTKICDTDSNRNNEQDNSLSINLKIDTDWMERMDAYSLLVKENIEYDQLMNDEQNKALAESIYLLIMDVLCSDEKTFKVNGTVMDAQIVRRRFLELRYLDVASVIDGIGRLAEPIRNARNYLLTALYNARATSETHWKADINSTMRAYRENPNMRPDKL